MKAALILGLLLGLPALARSHPDHGGVHYQADPARNLLPQGDFRNSRSDGKLQGWQGSQSAVSFPDPTFIRVKTDTPDAGAAIETHVDRPADCNWLTVMARTRIAPNAPLSEQQKAAISLSAVDATGKVLGEPWSIQETNREGYSNWIAQMKSFWLSPETKTLTIKIELTAGTGQFDCSELYVIPSDPNEELDRELVAKFRSDLQEGDAATVKVLLSIEPRLLECRNGENDNGTPLILCAWKELPEMAQVLLDAGANLDARDSNWKAPAIAWCGWWGSPKTAEVLLKAGADATRPTIYGVTPLSSAKAGKKANSFSKASPESYDQVIALFSAAPTGPKVK